MQTCFEINMFFCDRVVQESQQCSGFLALYARKGGAFCNLGILCTSEGDLLRRLILTKLQFPPSEQKRCRYRAT